jgi:hypothetical protein
MKIGLLGGLEPCFCHGKRPSKKKTSPGLRESPVNYTGILGQENGPLSILDAYFWKDSV